MPDGSNDRRVVGVPAVGARVCLLIAALFLTAAVYALLVPVQVTAANGRSFDCGTGLNQPASEFARGICGNANTIQQSRATALGVAALLTGVGGFLIFGLDRVPQVSARRRSPRPVDDGLPFD